MSVVDKDTKVIRYDDYLSDDVEKVINDKRKVYFSKDKEARA